MKTNHIGVAIRRAFESSHRQRAAKVASPRGPMVIDFQHMALELARQISAEESRKPAVKNSCPTIGLFRPIGPKRADGRCGPWPNPPSPRRARPAQAKSWNTGPQAVKLEAGGKAEIACRLEPV